MFCHYRKVHDKQCDKVAVTMVAPNQNSSGNAAVTQVNFVLLFVLTCYHNIYGSVLRRFASQHFILVLLYTLFLRERIEFPGIKYFAYIFCNEQSVQA